MGNVGLVPPGNFVLLGFLLVVCSGGLGGVAGGPGEGKEWFKGGGIVAGLTSVTVRKRNNLSMLARLLHTGKYLVFFPPFTYIFS